jgi:hypothetical protein
MNIDKKNQDFRGTIWYIEGDISKCFFLKPGGSKSRGNGPSDLGEWKHIVYNPSLFQTKTGVGEKKRGNVR